MNNIFPKLRFMFNAIRRIITVLLKPLTKRRDGSKTYISKNNKAVVITGCDSGIGLAVAKYSLEWGYYVVACCLSTESFGGKHLLQQGADVAHLDVCDSKTVGELLRKLSKLQNEGKDIWCLVNNAGIMTYAKTEWLTWNFVQSQLLVNLSGTIQVTRCVLPFTRASKGRIINVSSPQAFLSTPYMSVYCSSKSGLESFTTAVRRENQFYGVDAIIVRPCSLPNKTSILRKNCECLSEMKKEMNENSREEFKQEIEIMEHHFRSSFSSNEEHEDIDDPYLKECFRCAIDHPSPARIYTAAPLHVRLLLKGLSILPEEVMDFLMNRDIPNKIIDLAKS